MVAGKPNSLLYQLLERVPGGARDGDTARPSDNTLAQLNAELRGYIETLERQKLELQSAVTVDKLTEVGSPRELATQLAYIVLQAHKDAELAKRYQAQDKKSDTPKKIRRSSTGANGQQTETENADTRTPCDPHTATVAFLDSNDFKLINTCFGDPGGDVAIRLIGQFFKQNLRSQDRIATIDRKPFGMDRESERVYRKGGDEFVVLMQCSEADAKKRLNALKETFAKNVSGLFLDEMKKMYPEGDVGKDWEKRLAHYNDELAKKYTNDGLKQKPFQLSFSLGTVEVKPERFAHANFNRLDEVDAAATEIIREADAGMKTDKDLHKSAMADFGNSATRSEEFAERFQPTGDSHAGRAAGRKPPTHPRR
jgi:GGDEF domain-containing protein